MSVRQRVRRQVVRQFMHPHGIGGRLAGWVMAHRSSNVERNRWVVSLLDVQPADRILEIGFGPGIAVAEASRLATDGWVVGIDHSEVMMRMAQRRNARAIQAGRVDLRLGSAGKLPDLEGPFDKILAVNSFGFWREPVTRLDELLRLLRPGGTIAIGSQPRCPGATRETSAQAARDIEAVLRSAGFSPARTEMLELEPPVVCVLARSETSHPDDRRGRGGP